MKKILFLDDEVIILNTYKRVLISLGYQGFYATTSKEAMQLYNEHNIDLIISDYRLNNEIGLDFLSKIRKDNNKIPLLIVSGYAEETNIKKAIESQIIQDYLLKPVSLENLKSTLNNYIAMVK